MHVRVANQAEEDARLAAEAAAAAAEATSRGLGVTNRLPQCSSRWKSWT